MKLALVLFKYGVRLDDPCCFPLGFMYISAVLKRAGHDVAVFNENLYPFELSDLFGHDAVLMTGFEEFGPQIIETAAWCRENGLKTIFGGALATFKPQEMLQHVDTVIVGEGEEVIHTALHSCGIVQGTKPNLNNLPLPDYEGFGVSEYHRRNGIKHMGVLTSRGCPWSCRFCAHTCQFQYRDLAHVFYEIDRYRALYNPDLLVFNDNTLNISKRRFLGICQEMESRRLPWSAAIRLDNLDEETTAAAKRGGARYFVVGIESFDQRKLDGMNKQMNAAHIYRGLDLLHKHGIAYHGNILLGFPGETVESIEKEVAAIPQGYNIFPMMVQPFVGTAYQQRSISRAEYRTLQDRFKRYAEGRSMNVYPEAA